MNGIMIQERPFDFYVCVCVCVCGGGGGGARRFSGEKNQGPKFPEKIPKTGLILLYATKQQDHVGDEKKSRPKNIFLHPTPQ